MNNNYCGDCCYFFAECTDGDGCCAKHYWDVSEDGNPMVASCSQPACDDYISRQEKRHHLAVLLQHNRWRRDNEVPNSRRMVNPTELGKAIDFVIDYIRTYDKI